MSSGYHSNFAKWKETFARYRQLRGVSLKEALEKKTVSLAFRLWRETLKHSPTKEQLKAIPPANGWRIKRAPGMAVFTLKVTKTQLLYTYQKTLKSGRVVTKEKRRKFKVVDKPGEMERRIRGIGVTSKGWIPRSWPAAGGRFTKIRNPKGRVEYFISGTTFKIKLTNALPGASGMEIRHRIVALALDAELKDMLTYINRKQGEAMKQAGFQVTER